MQIKSEKIFGYFLFHNAMTLSVVLRPPPLTVCVETSIILCAIAAILIRPRKNYQKLTFILELNKSIFSLAVF